MFNTRHIIHLILLILLSHLACAQTFQKEAIHTETAHGTMKIRLFGETTRHSNNFSELCRGVYYYSLLFHRVINNFMIQGGDHLSLADIRMRCGCSNKPKSVNLGSCIKPATPFLIKKQKTR